MRKAVDDVDVGALDALLPEPETRNPKPETGEADVEALNALLPPHEAKWVSQQHKPSLAALDRIGSVPKP